MKIDQETSTRFNLLRFLPILGVVYVHAYGPVIKYSTGSVGVSADHLNYLTNFIRIFVTQGLARIAVPLFFLMAGYFLLVNFEWSGAGYLKKIKARGRSLFIPFLLWNISVMLFYLLMQSIPVLAPYFNFSSGSQVIDYTLYEYIDGVFGFHGFPLNYHFWFLRDLMLMVLFVAPVLSWISRYASAGVFRVFLVLYFGGMYLAWISSAYPYGIPNDMSATIWFSAGALCAAKRVSLFRLDAIGPAALIIWMISLVPDTIWQDASFADFFGTYSSNPFISEQLWTKVCSLNDVFHRTFIPVGVIGGLYATKLIMKHERLTNTLTALGGASFFIYAAHEPLLGIVRMAAYMYLPVHLEYTMLFIFLVVPISTVGLLLLWNEVWRKLSPKSLALFTGGRVPAPRPEMTVQDLVPAPSYAGRDSK
jgi:surface polysaccharide O-acyltransferase-like enzyme